VAILVHHLISFVLIDMAPLTQGDDVIKLIGVSVTINNSPLNVFSVYLPPASFCPTLYKPLWGPLLDYSDFNTIIMEDVNVHHGAWFATSTCSHGGDLVLAIDSSNLCILNSNTPTRLPNNGNPNSPDLTLISAPFVASSTWCTHIQLNSDHLPITVDFGDDTPPPRCARMFTDFHLADWSKFLAETESRFTDLPNPVSCAKGEQIFCDFILSASGHCIPSGIRKEYTPCLPCEAVPLTKRLDDLRCADPQDPEIGIPNEEISEIICRSSRKTWT
jgi:hypothetical protein